MANDPKDPPEPERGLQPYQVVDFQSVDKRDLEARPST
jgi:hypothetical protein